MAAARDLPRIEVELGDPLRRGAPGLVIDFDIDGDARVLGADMPAPAFVDMPEGAADDQCPGAGLRNGGVGADRVIAEQRPAGS